MSLLSNMIQQMSPVDFLNSLQGYNLNAGTDLMLEQAREVQMDNANFYWQGVAVPGVDGISFAARQTKEFTVSVLPMSLIISIAGDSTQDAGFHFSLVDKGSETKLFNKNVSKNVIAQRVALGTSTVNLPIGQHYLLSPFTITEPGSLQVSITNLATVAASIQLLINLAIPHSALKPKDGEVMKEGRLKYVNVIETQPVRRPLVSVSEGIMEVLK